MRGRLRYRAAIATALFPLAAASLTLGSAYTSSSTGPGGMSGYAVSGLRFDLDTTGSVASVRFRLSPGRARTVRVRLSPEGPWIACAVRRGAARCVLPAGTPAGGVAQFAVLAST